ncbi:MAG: carbon-nitrogen hydrolase family protein [Sedimentisphaerales bacterium]|nr:carbon-nitrogen hydrolase family protein [Sedimentisphaerales bacterium]
MMVEHLTAKISVSVWGIILVAIILLAFASHVAARSKGLTIAMCQIFVLDGDRQGNFVRIENAVAEAKKGGADIICLPETVLLGWVNPDAHQRACPIPGSDSDRLCALARKYKAYICIGLAERDGEELHDSVILIDDNGQILLKHRKIIILSELMTPPYTPGSDVNVVETKFGRIGLLICADTHRDEILLRMAKLKPDLLLVPYGYAEKEDSWPDHGKRLEFTVTKAASRTNAIVVGTNSVGEITNGPWTGYVFGGQSIAADKAGKTITTAKDRDRDIKLLRVDSAP